MRNRDVSTEILITLCKTMFLKNGKIVELENVNVEVSNFSMVPVPIF